MDNGTTSRLDAHRLTKRRYLPFCYGWELQDKFKCHVSQIRGLRIGVLLPVQIARDRSELDASWYRAARLSL